jgi:diadenosine tetraphosphate (Ap4A) HIT family hydrolase
MTESVNCPFCALAKDRIVLESSAALAIRDKFPVTHGHTLIIPRRHIASFFETTQDERTQMLSLLDAVKLQLDKELAPAGYNIGINDGAAAGQTVMHLHVHLIPRSKGDSPDPRGGVRWIFPEKAAYWDKG